MLLVVDMHDAPSRRAVKRLASSMISFSRTFSGQGLDTLPLSA